MALRIKLPPEHLDSDSKDVVKLVMGVVASMSALVLSLLIASGSGSLQAQRSELQSLAANVLLLDRVLAFYGPEAQETRDALHTALQVTHDRIWSPSSAGIVTLDPTATQSVGVDFFESLQHLSPKNEEQRSLRSEAVQLSGSIARVRYLLFEQSGSGIALPFLAVLVFWLCVLFLGFGLFTRFNATVAVAHLIGALSVWGAIFLILELNQPYHGILRLSDAPLRATLVQIDR
jgi:hypothetical protein